MVYLFGFPYLSLKLSLTFPTREKCFEFIILGILIFQEVLTEFNFSTKFPILEKFANLMKCFEFNILGILIFQEVLTEFNFSTKFPSLEKFVNLMKDLKYEHQSMFSLWERVKLNFRDRYGKENIFVRTPAAVKFFHQIEKKSMCMQVGLKIRLM